MSIKVRLPNGRYVKVNTEDADVAKQQAISYYQKGNTGFVDRTTRDLAGEYDKDFDYESGVDATWLRVKLGAMETLAGKEKVLESSVGSKGFTRDSQGNLALTPNGLRTLGIVPNTSKNVVIDESGFSANDFADFAGIYGPIAGSIAGSIITRGKIKPKVKNIKTLSLFDLGKVSLGTGAGATGGKALEEGFEYMSGLQDNSPEELAKIAAAEFAIGAGAEFGLGALGKLLKHTFGNRVMSRYGKEDPEVGRKLLLEASAASKGVYDPVTKKTYKGAIALAALESPILGRLQPIIETIADYKGRTDQLTNLLFTDLKNVYRSTNDLSAGYAVNIDELKRLGFADAGGDVQVGKAVKDKINKSFNQSSKEVEKSSAKINESVNKIIGNFDAFADPATSESGAAIRSFAEQSFAQWKKTSDDLYAPLKEFFSEPVNLEPNIAKFMPGGELRNPIQFINTAPIRSFAENLKIRKGDSLKTESGASLAQDIGYLENLGGNDGIISLEELLTIREDLASKVRITPTGKAKYADLADFERTEALTVINNVMKNLENGGALVDGLIAAKKGVTAEKVQQYLKLIGLSNRFYSGGFQAFDRAFTHKVLKDAEMGGENIDKVIQYILKRNNGEEVKRFLDTLDSSTAGFRKTRQPGTKIVARSQPPERFRIGESLEGQNVKGGLLKDLDLKIDEPDFMFKEQAIKTLQKEFIRKIVKSTSTAKDPINFTKIANQIDSYGTTGDILFGSSVQKKALIQTLKEVDTLSNVGSLKEFDDLLTKSIDSEDLISTLRNKISASEELADVTNLDIFTKIQRGTIDPEEITQAIFKPANSEQISQIKQIMGGEESEAFKQFQLSAMRKILDNVVNPGEDVMEKLFNEGAFARALDGYGDAVLKETFGEQQFKTLMKVKDRFRFIVGGERKAGGGGLFTSGFIFNFIMRPLQAARVFTPIQLVAMLMARPTFVKWLAGEVSDKAMIKEVPSILDYGAKIMGVPISPVLKQPIGQTIPRGIIAGEEQTQDFVKNPSRISPEAELLDAMPALENQRSKIKNQVSLDLPEILPTRFQTSRSAGRTSSALLPSQIDRDLALLLNQSNP